MPWLMQLLFQEGKSSFITQVLCFPWYLDSQLHPCPTASQARLWGTLSFAWEVWTISPVPKKAVLIQAVQRLTVPWLYFLLQRPLLRPLSAHWIMDFPSLTLKVRPEGWILFISVFLSFLTDWLILPMGWFQVLIPERILFNTDHNCILLFLGYLLASGKKWHANTPSYPLFFSHFPVKSC